VRLVYLDEAGTTSKATWLVVAGVIVHGDRQYPEADRRIAALVEKYIPEENRLGFTFHATDIFHGSRYFDRNKPQWATREQRWPILIDLAQIIADLELPIVVGTGDKAPLLGEPESSPSENADRLHVWSVINCLFWAETWLTAFSPEEMATVIHEDGAAAKPVIKRIVRLLRHPEQMIEGEGLSVAQAFSLPFDHLIDTVHFAEKADARLLQLADLSAFMIARAVQGRSVCEPVMKVLMERTDWSRSVRPRAVGVYGGLQK
jgi:hypothetical protein